MGMFSEMLMCGDITVTTLCTKLTRRHSVSSDWYFMAPFYMATVTIPVVAGILVPSAASC